MLTDSDKTAAFLRSVEQAFHAVAESEWAMTRLLPDQRIPGRLGQWVLALWLCHKTFRSLIPWRWLRR